MQTTPENPTRPKITFTGTLHPTTLTKHQINPTLSITITATLLTHQPITIWPYRTIFCPHTSIYNNLEILDPITNTRVFSQSIDICGPIINGIPMDWPHAASFLTLYPNYPHVFELDLSSWRKNCIPGSGLDERLEVGKRYIIRFEEDSFHAGIRNWAWGSKGQVLQGRVWRFLGYKARLAGEMWGVDGEEIRPRFLEDVEFYVGGDDATGCETEVCGK